eukprot:CAMPEP_0174261920 /NCGR_PEP_ID=MMETSP0439-20130205/12664_1 /TAXON_ID=0 /ORGANISM="Stereomyxa ramosa, Strain Chinc5" /LENGTH=306 /DNA_ID=CAMNT_0015346529 /DNA_START=22 /DNA_END=942 /DNA_ORIENTATION=-
MSYNWCFTGLRVGNLAASAAFYSEHFGLKQLVRYEIPQQKLKACFLVNLPASVSVPEPNSPEALELALGGNYDFLELRQFGEEGEHVYDSGNVEPKRGFGHTAFLCDDVYAACDDLLSKGVGFQKKPDEGRMKGLAFALDPDGYWVEIIKREEHDLDTPYNLAQTMLRVKDAKRSLDFYKNLLGMTVIGEKHFDAAAFSLFFLSSRAPEGLTDDNGWAVMKKMQNPVLELTYNHGSEEDDSFHYYAEDPQQAFSHLGVLVEDDQAVEAIGEVKPGEWFSVAKDPDGYSIHLVSKKDFVSKLGDFLV